MKKNYLLLGVLISLMSLSNLYGQDSKIKLSSLTCEYLDNPLGIDVIQPRLSWKLVSDEQNKTQSAYRILVASSLDLLEKNEGDLWDTDKMKSNHVVYLKLDVDKIEVKKINSVQYNFNSREVLRHRYQADEDLDF